MQTFCRILPTLTVSARYPRWGCSFRSLAVFRDDMVACVATENPHCDCAEQGWKVAQMRHLGSAFVAASRGGSLIRRIFINAWICKRHGEGRLYVSSVKSMNLSRALTVYPLLNFAGCHTEEVGVGPSIGNGLSDLEPPFPQTWFHLNKCKFNAPSIHLKSSDSPRDQARPTGRLRLF